MNRETFTSKQRSVNTSSGQISYVENGKGPVALSVHGATTIKPDQDVSYDAQAVMLAQFLDELNRGKPSPAPSQPHAHELRRARQQATGSGQGVSSVGSAGGLKGALEKMLADNEAARSDQGSGLWYERVHDVADQTFATYLRPLVSSPSRVRDLERFFAAWDNTQTVRIEGKLRALTVPTLIVWGTDDVFFDVSWSRWLERTIPLYARILLSLRHLGVGVAGH